MEYCTVIGPVVYRVAEQTAVKEVTRPLPSLAEWSVATQDQGFTVVSTERMRMAKASIGNAACAVCLPPSARGPSGLMFQKLLGSNFSWIPSSCLQ